VRIRDSTVFKVYSHVFGEAYDVVNSGCADETRNVCFRRLMVEVASDAPIASNAIASEVAAVMKGRTR